MDRKTGNIGEEDYIAIKFSEYKELLIIKGKYEELREHQERPSIQYIPNIQPLTYPNDLSPKVTFRDAGRENEKLLESLNLTTTSTTECKRK